ncbi:MAG: hypothetical protein HUJ68_08730 [Clostridia bacterium]|nr:hypothetical protein [Clostridia bacterium]
MAKKLTEEEKLEKKKEAEKLKKEKAAKKKKEIAERKKLSEAKSAFRATNEWKDFRNKLLVEGGFICQFCGNKYASKNMVLHHAFVAQNRDGKTPAEDYMDLRDPSRFRILCKRCHKLLHSLGEIKNPSPVVQETKECIRKTLGDEWVDLKQPKEK